MKNDYRAKASLIVMLRRKIAEMRKQQYALEAELRQLREKQKTD